MNWKRYRRKRYSQNLRYDSGIWAEELRKRTKVVTQHSRCPGWDSNPSPHEIYALLLERCSIVGCEILTTVVMKIYIFWDITSRRPLNVELCRAFYVLHAGFLLGLFSDTNYGRDMFIRNFEWHSTDYTALHSRWQSRSKQFRNFKKTLQNSGGFIWVVTSSVSFKTRYLLLRLFHTNNCVVIKFI
jgi:hypothetical protein